MKADRFLLLAAAALSVCIEVPASAEVIGTMTSAEELSEARIVALPAEQRDAWIEYWRRSQARLAGHKAALAAEHEGVARTLVSPPAGNPASMPLDRDAAWYASPEARYIAENIVSFQTPAGGWDKNQDRAGPLRARGQGWASVGTIDNGATTTELRFLARVQQAFPEHDGDVYRAAFLRGVRYLLEAQYPNGGWPQIYPLQGGYHDAVTYNDDAMINVVNLLAEVAPRQKALTSVPDTLAAEARKAVDRAIALIVRTQVVVGGCLTGWGQQHDALTLAPVGARNFEPAALASPESAALLEFLMRLPSPSPEVVGAVHEGAAWLEARTLRGVEWASAGSDGRQLLPKPGATPIWARFNDIATMRPIFGDRDRTINDNVNELSLERRNGYSWFGTRPARTLSFYSRWAASHGRGETPHKSCE